MVHFIFSHHLHHFKSKWKYNICYHNLSKIFTEMLFFMKISYSFVHMYLSWNFPKIFPSLSRNRLRRKKIYRRFLTLYFSIPHTSPNISLDRLKDIYGSLTLGMLYIFLSVFLFLKLLQSYLDSTVWFSPSFPDIYPLSPNYYK